VVVVPHAGTPLLMRVSSLDEGRIRLNRDTRSNSFTGSLAGLTTELQITLQFLEIQHH
jgi:hypothetical protein